jgi:hypothetical protein
VTVVVVMVRLVVLVVMVVMVVRLVVVSGDNQCTVLQRNVCNTGGGRAWLHLLHEIRTGGASALSCRWLQANSAMVNQSMRNNSPMPDGSAEAGNLPNGWEYLHHYMAIIKC